MGGALLSRIQSGESRLEDRLVQVQNQLQADLARHAGAIGEDVRKYIAALDDKYRDLPDA